MSTPNQQVGSRPGQKTDCQCTSWHRLFGQPPAAAMPVFIFLAATAAVVTILTPATWLVLLDDGLRAVAVILAAAGLGAWPACWLSTRRRSATQQFTLAAALGLGLLSTLTLALGIAGGLNSITAWTLVIVGLALGLLRLKLTPPADHASPDTAGSPTDRRRRVLIALALLVLAIPAGIALFGASLPPGTLWAGENRAYDALEYHLEAPREYYDAGQIHFLPHNVYASFPQQVEMLYLLLMHLMGGPYGAALACQLVHVLGATLTVVALIAWTPAGWPRVVVALLAASTPWVAYLGCLAYVEMGMLLFAAVAAGLLLETLRDATSADWRTILAAGLCIGLAGGCKYTALVLIAAALGLAWLIVMNGGPLLRLRRAVIFGAATLLAFSPWLIRNVAFTGNPVYPFAYSVFGGQAWSAAQTAQWDRGHQVPPERASIVGRLQILWDEVPASARFGPALILLGLVGLLLARNRAAMLLAIWLVLTLLCWATLTHMPGRFAVPIIVPLVLLAGLGTECCSHSATRRRAGITLFVLATVAGAAINARQLSNWLAAEDRFWNRFAAPLDTILVHGPQLFRQVQDLNSPELIGPDDRAWLVGDAAVFYVDRNIHYTVVFSRDPWLAAARDATPAEAIDWLRTQNVTRVVFSWTEIDRLATTYGFPDWVTRQWVDQLAHAGLKRVYPPADSSPAPVEIYQVTPA